MLGNLLGIPNIQYLLMVFLIYHRKYKLRWIEKNQVSRKKKLRSPKGLFYSYFPVIFALIKYKQNPITNYFQETCQLR